MCQNRAGTRSPFVRKAKESSPNGEIGRHGGANGDYLPGGRHEFPRADKALSRGSRGPAFTVSGKRDEADRAFSTRDVPRGNLSEIRDNEIKRGEGARGKKVKNLTQRSPGKRALPLKKRNEGKEKENKRKEMRRKFAR